MDERALGDTETTAELTKRDIQQDTETGTTQRKVA
jgi:hypothetical protein